MRELLDLAKANEVDVRVTAVRELSRAAIDREEGASLRRLADELHESAIKERQPMPIGSTTKLVYAHLHAGEVEKAASAIEVASRARRTRQSATAAVTPSAQAYAYPSSNGDARAVDLGKSANGDAADSAPELTDLGRSLDLLHSLARQERQRSELQTDERVARPPWLRVGHAPHERERSSNQREKSARPADE